MGNRKKKHSREKSRKSRSKTAAGLRSSKTPRVPDCPHCEGGPETYGYLQRAFVYDVDLAREIVSDGRFPVELDDADTAYCVENSRIHKQHLDHVNTAYPGILAHLWGPGENGVLEHGHLLIDGNHRAARCLRDRITFRAYVLTEEESERILKRGMRRDGSVYDYRNEAQK